MRKQNSRIAIRLPSKTRNQIDCLVRTGKNRSISEVIRKALTEFLQNERGIS